MYCPYRTRVSQGNQLTFVYDDDGKSTVQWTVFLETVDFLPCYGPECAMWQDGKCVKR